MLSYEQWLELQSKTELCHQAFINGRFVDAVNGAVFSCVSPVNEQELTPVAACDAADVDVAVAAARKSFEAGSWSRAAPAERKRVLLKLADLMEQHQDELAMLDSIDMGKSIYEMVYIDIPDAIDCFRWTAEAIDKLYGEIAPTRPGSLALISREPVGVVGAITPWNYPMLMMSWKIAPALAAGNSIVLKPSEKSPLSALRFAQLATEAGIPDGVFNVLPGFGDTAGKALALHMDVDTLAFTGSTRVASQLLQYAGQSNMKRVWLEAGGKSPCLVFADCKDLELAAQGAARAIFGNQGEVCIACSRLYVEESVRAEFTPLLLKAAEEFVAGHPLHPDTRMGPMVDQAQLETVNRFIRGALAEGGELLCGGEKTNAAGAGFFAQPTIIGNVRQDMELVREEVFGPVLAMGSFSSEQQAIALANDSRYGLAASIWTDDISQAHRVSQSLRTGMVWVNTWGNGDTTVPFGGVKASGNARDKSLHAFDKYSDIKNTWIQLKGF